MWTAFWVVCVLATLAFAFTIYIKKDIREDGKSSRDHERAVRRIENYLPQLREALGADLYGRLVESGKRPDKHVFRELMLQWAPYESVVFHGTIDIFGWQSRFALTKEDVGIILEAYLRKMELERKSCFQMMSQRPKADPWILVDEAHNRAQAEVARDALQPIMSRRGNPGGQPVASA